MTLRPFHGGGASIAALVQIPVGWLLLELWGVRVLMLSVPEEWLSAQGEKALID
jgi:hypothetical protein